MFSGRGDMLTFKDGSWGSVRTNLHVPRDGKAGNRGARPTRVLVNSHAVDSGGLVPCP